ncbi:hypothetical protein FISHEDRAFT_68448 [Fistulina hepatica ATCC 64428]|uniref:Uncharacterized protein n=1 Tax=Fistulina hepatica ATCC 64428 TaxID=1128425 RepID=A0A0D7AST8_9AGAR|nr:hypothetical protein FISHEDRAFT_68448 [Fistulina hepatica ATCC 64428]
MLRGTTRQGAKAGTQGEGPMVPVKQAPSYKTRRAKAAKQHAEKLVLLESVRRKSLFASIDSAESARRGTEAAWQASEHILAQQVREVSDAEAELAVQLGEDLSDSLHGLKDDTGSTPKHFQRTHAGLPVPERRAPCDAEASDKRSNPANLEFKARRRRDSQEPPLYHPSISNVSVVDIPDADWARSARSRVVVQRPQNIVSDPNCVQEEGRLVEVGGVLKEEQAATDSLFLYPPTQAARVSFI